MNKKLMLVFVTIIVFSCKNNADKQIIAEESKSDQIYQYSLFTALANKIYDGTITVADVKKKGDTGLGTFNGLNGEMIVAEGKVFQCLGDGTVRLPEDNELVPFAVVTFFEADKKMNIENVDSFDEMKTLILKNMDSKNFGYAFKIHADFETLKLGSAKAQSKPYENTLSEALVDRPVFNLENISGKLVGFWYPEYIGKINVEGFHLHFISDDENHAGHAMDFSAKNIKVEIDICEGFEIDLPLTEAFKTLELDLSQEYGNNK